MKAYREANKRWPLPVSGRKEPPKKKALSGPKK